MKLAKFGHSCIRLTDGDRSLVIDPGVFTDVPAALDGVHTVLITHEHPDHLDADALRRAAAADPSLQVFAPASVTAQLADLGGRVNSVTPGEPFEAGGWHVNPQGGQHALIHPTIPMIANIGYVVKGVYHPGDSFIVPAEPVSTVLVPVHAPWSKTAEVIDFAVAVRAQRALNIHDFLLKDVGLSMVEGHVGRIGGQFGVEFAHLSAGESTDL